MSALAQRLAREREQPGLERLVEAARGREPRAPALERAQAQLPEALTLEEDPVLVPVRQQVQGERLLRDSGRAARQLECASVSASRRSTRTPGASRSMCGSAATSSGACRWMRQRAERRLPAARVLGPVEPQRAGDVGSEHRPLVERDEGDDALGAARKCHLLALDFHAEARE